MPAVVGVIGAVIGGIASAVGAVVATIGAIIGPIVGAITAVISPIISGITGTLGTITSTIMGPLTKITDVIKIGLQGPIDFIKGDILGPVADIQNGLLGGIRNIGRTITTATMPVLGPIRDTMTTINGYVGGVRDIITDGLAPIKDVAEVVRSISTIKMTQQLLAGTQSLSDVIGGVADEAGIETAGAIAGLWRDTVDTTTGIMTTIEDHYKLVTGEIDSVEDRLMGEREAAMIAIHGSMDLTLASLEATFSGEAQRLRREVAIVERRVEDIPEFQRMLIRALS